MERLIGGLLGAFYEMLGRPGSQVEFWVAGVAALVVCVFMLRKVAEAANVRGAGFLTALVSGLAGALLLVAAYGFGGELVRRLGIVPERWTNIAAAGVVGLVVVIPLTCALMRADYLAAAFSWLVSILAVGIAVFIVGAVFNLGVSMKHDAKAAGEHRKAIEDYIDLLGQ